MPQIDPRRSNAGAPPPGYRLPAQARPGRVVLQVADLDRSLGFYDRLLGFAVRDRSGGRATLTSVTDAQPLVELHEHQGAAPVPGSGHLGLYHFAVLLPDRASLGRLIAHLARADARAGMSDHLVSESIYLRDPDGLGIEVYADRPVSQWRWNGNELQMGTAPLDVDDLVRAAGTQPWVGMPAGTRIGHLHLHVGDLKKAASFYHAGLGLDVTVRGYPGALFMSAGGYHHHLGVNVWAANAPRAAQGDARLLEWTLLLPSPEDAGSAAESLRNAGYDVKADGSDRLAADPWGTVLHLTIERSSA